VCSLSVVLEIGILSDLTRHNQGRRGAERVYGVSVSPSLCVRSAEALAFTPIQQRPNKSC